MMKKVVNFYVAVGLFLSLVAAGCASSGGSSSNGGGGGGGENFYPKVSCSAECPSDMVCVGSADDKATCAIPCDGGECPEGMTCCNGGCVSLFTDKNNCGGCGIYCEGGTCQNAKCIDACGGTCGPNQKCCGGVCVDVKTDKNNCGECGNVCDPERSNACVNGACMCGTKAQCVSGKTCCGNDCVDTNSDPFNCGACGRTCPNGTQCINGQCLCGSEECTQGETCCGNYCADLNNDPHNCGECGHDCSAEGGPNSQCIGGQCTCGASTQVCRGEITSAEDSHCAQYTGDMLGSGSGKCLEECCHNPDRCAITKAQPMDFGIGIGLAPSSADPNNCGACGNACNAGEDCCCYYPMGIGSSLDDVACECCDGTCTITGCDRGE